MGKFNVGDKVKIIDDKGSYNARGRVGKVGTVTDSDNLITEAKMDDGVLVRQYHKRFELVAAFAIGAKVRLTDRNEGFGDKGDIGTVSNAVDSDGNYKVRLTTGSLAGQVVFVPASLLEAAPTWIPKVGDKVRYIGASGGYYTVGQIYEILEQTISGGFRLTDDRPRTTLHYWTSADEIRKVFEFAPFKVEVGKYYRTRDGRKVGPIEENWADSVYWPFKSAGRMYYKPNGYSCPGSARNHRETDDLVAEWNEAAAAKPIAKTASAQVDAIAEEYGPVIAKAAPSETAIVCLIEAGQPKPSSYPHVHSSVSSAKAEADRLAGVHKGSHFGVYVATGDLSFVAKPTYRHEWQRKAANGNKIGAIKDLRAATDIGLKAAKDAVEDWLSREAA